MADSDKSPLLQYAELALKIGTAVIATLYVFGLMISNAQLVELGIADFASLQARNVMVGLLFVIYSLVLASIFAPVTLMIPVSIWLKSKYGRSFVPYLLMIAAFLYLQFVVLAAADAFVGYLSPWGRSFGSSTSLSVIYQGYKNQTSQLHETFYRKEISALVALVLTAEILVFSLFILKTRYRAQTSNVTRALRTPLVMSIILAALVFYSTFALFDYAYRVYPNFRFNIGGGQPQISDLTLTGKRSEMAGFTDTGLLPQQICCTGTDDETYILRDIAIWYQSDKFLYVAKAARDAKSRVIAIDLKLVRSIHYLAKHAKVISGARIDDVRSD